MFMVHACPSSAVAPRGRAGNLLDEMTPLWTRAAAVYSMSALLAVTSADVGDSVSLDELHRIVKRFASEFQPDEVQRDDPRNFTLQQQAREWMLNSRIEGLGINRTELRSESVAGLGLFAMRDIQPGELITCYPGDVLMYHPTDGILFGGHVPESMRHTELVDSWWLDYSLAEDDDYAVVAIPGLNQDPAYLGHYANDGARLLGVDESAADEYVAASERARNAQHVDIEGGLHMVTLATRRIRSGEEIFVSYGEEYWLEFNARHGALEVDRYDVDVDVDDGVAVGAGGDEPVLDRNMHDEL